MMITFEEALKILLAAAKPLGMERSNLENLCGRILAEDILSDINMPPFPKSAMDGYACRRADLANDLTVVEQIPAGHMPQHKIGPNECAQIMTGAPVPEGADCVVMVEQIERLGANIIRSKNLETPDHICRLGEDIRKGDKVLGKEEKITPAHIAVLASVGAINPLVFIRPRITVLATGSELVEPETSPNLAQIRNSNSYQLCAQIQEMGAVVRYGGIVIDSPAITTEAIANAMATSDVILLSGGVSMGEFDFVTAALQENGFNIRFDSVAMQPGRPTVFGTTREKYCCGLPGNPVSTYVVFETLLKPFLYKLMGYDYKPTIVRAILANEIARRNASRQLTVPVRFSAPETVESVEYHGSAHINALTRAHALLTVPKGRASIPAGEEVLVRLLEK